MRIKNILWNLSGLAVPAVCAAFTVPSIFNAIGVERFSILTLAWGLIAFSGIFDLGIGRAATQYISKRKFSNDSTEILNIASTAVRLSITFGLIGSGVLLFSIALGLPQALKYSTHLGGEITQSAYILVIIIPIQSLSALYRGINEAYESFRSVSLIRMAMGIATFAGPYTVSLFTDSLGPIISTLLISRAVGLLLFRRFAQRCLQREHDQPDPSMKSSISPAVIRQLLTFGGWLTVSSIVYPIMMQADRFIIGGTISASAVAGYTIPYEVVLQTLVLVGAITTVAFPRLTSLLTDNPKESLDLFYRWLAYSVGLMATVGSALAASFPIILPLWIGNQLPGEAILVGQILCFGLVPYTIGTMYLAIIHACGRPDVTAKAHLLEAPLYFLLLFAMIQQYGLTGAAWAWNIRATLDAVMLVIWFEIKEKPSLT